MPFLKLRGNSIDSVVGHARAMIEKERETGDAVYLTQEEILKHWVQNGAIKKPGLKSRLLFLGARCALGCDDGKAQYYLERGLDGGESDTPCYRWRALMRPQK